MCTVIVKTIKIEIYSTHVFPIFLLYSHFALANGNEMNRRNLSLNLIKR